MGREVPPPLNHFQLKDAMSHDTHYSAFKNSGVFIPLCHSSLYKKTEFVF